uniref:Uncharacterized protein n=1 Tax=Plectus sambesii TaxID=2011161 RepID=A0A914VLX1_9BILA
MRAHGAIVFTAFCMIHVAFGIGVPKILELIKDINYVKIKKAFPNTADADLVSRRTKLESLNNRVISSMRKSLASLNVTKNPKFDNRPETPPEISTINQVLAPYLYEMDIILTDQQMNELVANARKKRKAVSYTSYKWPTKATGVIPYFLDAGLTLTFQPILCHSHVDMASAKLIIVGLCVLVAVLQTAAQRRQRRLGGGGPGVTVGPCESSEQLLQAAPQRRQRRLGGGGPGVTVGPCEPDAQPGWSGQPGQGGR